VAQVPNVMAGAPKYDFISRAGSQIGAGMAQYGKDKAAETVQEAKRAAERKKAAAVVRDRKSLDTLYKASIVETANKIREINPDMDPMSARIKAQKFYLTPLETSTISQQLDAIMDATEKADKSLAKMKVGRETSEFSKDIAGRDVARPPIDQTPQAPAPQPAEQGFKIPSTSISVGASNPVPGTPQAPNLEVPGVTSVSGMKPAPTPTAPGMAIPSRPINTSDSAARTMSISPEAVLPPSVSNAPIKTLPYEEREILDAQASLSEPAQKAVKLPVESAISAERSRRSMNTLAAGERPASEITAGAIERSGGMEMTPAEKQLASAVEQQERNDAMAADRGVRRQDARDKLSTQGEKDADSEARKNAAAFRQDIKDAQAEANKAKTALAKIAKENQETIESDWASERDKGSADFKMASARNAVRKADKVLAVAKGKQADFAAGKKTLPEALGVKDPRDDSGAPDITPAQKADIMARVKRELPGGSPRERAKLADKYAKEL